MPTIILEGERLHYRVPEGGLLNPNLREGFGRLDLKKILKSTVKK